MKGISKLSADALVDRFDEIQEGMRQYFVASADTSGKREILNRLVAFLDELDEDEAFGAEGWRQTFGMD